MLAFVLAQLILLAPAQPPQTDAPRAYRPEFENGRVRVSRVRYAPREKISSHDHPANPTVYVYLRSSGPVRFTHTGEENFTLTRPAVKAGGFRLSKGAKETHGVESLTDQPTEYLRVEFKGLTVDRQTFRGRFPPEPPAARRRAGQKVRYEDKNIRVTRVTCAARRPCAGLSGRDASLLVALTPAQLRSAGAGAELTLALGQTVWAETGAAPPFANASDRPAEFLKIDLLIH
jgi:quercetin dioxygenase-like cupin family protein